MQDKIRQLDDAKALAILSAFARARMRLTGNESAPSKDVGRAMEEFLTNLSGTRGESTTQPPVTDGELARAALLLLADDAEHCDGIRALVTGTQPERFLGVEMIAAVVAGLVVLQTRVKITRDKQGKCALEIEKQPTKDSLLKDLVKALVSRLGS